MNAKKLRTFSREDIYQASPRLAQEAVITLEGLRCNIQRYGPGYRAIAAEVKARGDLGNEATVALRNTRTVAFARAALSDVPYYQDLGRTLGICSEDIRVMSDLALLPILSKEDVQLHAKRLENVSSAAPRRIPVHTSGTTGRGLHFVTNSRAIREQWATWWRYRNWHGIARGTWCAYFGGRAIVAPHQRRPPYWRYNLPARQIVFSAYHLSPASARFYIEELNRRRPPWLHGYPSVLGLLAAHVLEGLPLRYGVRWITTGAESLLPHQAAVIREAFGVTPVEHYGMAEAVANASMCEQGRLHIDEDFAAVELIPTESKSLYRIIGTNISNPSFPMIRYDTGDLATPYDGRQCCHRSGRVLESVDGRREDFVVLRDGRRLGRMDHIFKDMTRIREAQILQSVPGELTVRVVRAAGFGAEDEELLRREFARRLPPENAVAIDYVDRLERSGTGKLRFVVSTIGPLPSADR